MNLTRFSHENPFDSIRRIDAQGNEIWYARELMTIMGYQSWQRFETPITQAMENLELSGDVVSEHFNSKAKKSKGRTANDYGLSRYGAYNLIRIKPTGFSRGMYCDTLQGARGF